MNVKRLVSIVLTVVCMTVFALTLQADEQKYKCPAKKEQIKQEATAPAADNNTKKAPAAKNK